MRLIDENLKNTWEIPQTDLEGYLKHTPKGPEKTFMSLREEAVKGHMPKALCTEQQDTKGSKI